MQFVKGRAFSSAFLSLVVPGLGQIYSGSSGRGAAILIAVIIVGNLNAIWLSIYAGIPPVSNAFWDASLPRILLDLFAFYGIIFLVWQVVDAYKLGKTQQPPLKTEEIGKG